MPALRTLLLPIILLGLVCTAAQSQSSDGYAEPGVLHVRVGQAILGIFGGTVGTVLGGLAGFLLMPPCVYDGIETGAVAQGSARRPCGDLGLMAGLTLGAVAGASGGIYAVGHNGGRQGSFLATAGGAAAGLAAGLLLAGPASMHNEAAFAFVAGSTTLSGLAAYHFTDRVRLRASLLPPDGDGHPRGASFRLELALR